MKQKKAWSFFQSLGKAFMYPIALLSVCGMMLGLGSGLDWPPESPDNQYHLFK